MQIKQIIHDVLIYMCYKSAKNSTILPTKMFSALGVAEGCQHATMCATFPFPSVFDPGKHGWERPCQWKDESESKVKV